MSIPTAERSSPTEYTSAPSGETLQYQSAQRLVDELRVAVCALNNETDTRPDNPLIETIHLTADGLSTIYNQGESPTPFGDYYLLLEAVRILIEYNRPEDAQKILGSIGEEPKTTFDPANNDTGTTQPMRYSTNRPPVPPDKLAIAIQKQFDELGEILHTVTTDRRRTPGPNRTHLAHCRNLATLSLMYDELMFVDPRQQPYPIHDASLLESSRRALEETLLKVLVVSAMRTIRKLTRAPSPHKGLVKNYLIATSR